MMTSGNTSHLWQEYGRVMVAVALNIIRETPPHLTPRQFATNLISVLRHPQSLEKPTRQRQKTTVRSKKGTPTTPPPQFLAPPHTGDANDGGVVEVSGAASKSTERVPAASVTTKRKRVKGIKDRHPSHATPSVCISVKPLEKLTNLSQDSVVEGGCVDVLQDASGARLTGASEANVVGNKQFFNTSSYHAVRIEGSGDVQKENIIPIPPEKQKVHLHYKSRAMCGVNNKSDGDKLNSIVVINPKTSPGSCVASLDSTWQTPPAEGRTENHASSQCMIDITNDDWRSLYVDIQNVPDRLCSPSTSPLSTSIPHVSSSSNKNSSDSSTGSGGPRTNTNDGWGSVIPDTDATNTLTRDKLPTSATSQGNKNNDDRSRRETVDIDTSITADDTNTRRNKTDTVSGRQNSGKANTTNKTLAPDGYIGDADEGYDSRNDEGGSGPTMRGYDQQDQMNSRCKVIRGCDVVLGEVRQEVEAGLEAASRASQHNWSNCYRSVKEVKEALREAPGTGRREADLCVTFLTEVLTALLGTSPPHTSRSPTHWWLALKAVESVVVAVSTWTPLLVRAGNLLLQALIFICHKINYRIAGREYLAEVAYSLAVAITRVVIAACNTIEPEEPPTTATSEFSESFTFSEQPSIEAALAVLNPGANMNYMNEWSWATFNEEGILYSGPCSAASPAGETAEECLSQSMKSLHTPGEGIAEHTPEPSTGETRGSEGNTEDMILNADKAPRRTIGPMADEAARKEAITAALVALAPYSRRRDTMQPLFKKPRTSAQEKLPANTSSPQDTANVEWNLLYWRSVIREECEPHADFLPMFGFQITEIIRIIDRCCG
nr:uncharacterized protein LOC123765473 [Procambarus clarkii]